MPSVEPRFADTFGTLKGVSPYITGAAEAVYEWSGSGANPRLRIEQAPKDAATRGVWGMPPPGNV